MTGGTRIGSGCRSLSFLLSLVLFFILTRRIQLFHCDCLKDFSWFQDFSKSLRLEIFFRSSFLISLFEQQGPLPTLCHQACDFIIGFYSGFQDILKISHEPSHFLERSIGLKQSQNSIQFNSKNLVILNRQTSVPYKTLTVEVVHIL